MSTLTRIAKYGAAIIVVICSATMFVISRAAADPNGATVVALEGSLRRCDFSPLDVTPMVPRPGLGTGSVLVHTAGSRAVAEVHVVDAPDPGTHY